VTIRGEYIDQLTVITTNTLLDASTATTPAPAPAATTAVYQYFYYTFTWYATYLKPAVPHVLSGAGTSIPTITYSTSLSRQRKLFPYTS
jgi:hypothetical protein